MATDHSKTDLTSDENMIDESVAQTTLSTTQTNESQCSGTAGVSFVGSEGPHVIHLRQAMHKTVKKCIGAARFVTISLFLTPK